jgi:hypothetical protein
VDGGLSVALRGTLAGPGTVQGDVSNAGTLAPGAATGPGVLTINGSYTQTATGTLSLNIGGPQAGTDYSQLVVTGLARLDGTLQVKMTNGYRPQPGDSFHPLLWGQSQGAFARYTGANSLFSFLYDEGGLTLVAN